MARQPSPAGLSEKAADSRPPQKSASKRRSPSGSLANIFGVDRSSSSTTSSSADSASHTDGSLGQSDKMSEHQTVLLDEIHRLTTENANLQHKLETGVVTPLSPESKEVGITQTGLREQNKTLANENSRLQEQVAQLERRILTGKAPLPVQGKDDEVTDREKVLQTDVKRLRAENTTLIKENQRLSYEIYQVNKVATIVASRVAKVLVGARRSSNNNTQLVTELKRWNRKLEYENNRLYEIIDKLSSGNASGLTAELKAKSSHKGQESAQLVRRLEDQNKNLQEEINRLSTDTAIMQSMAVRADADASPRAPSDASSALSSLPASDETRQHSPGKQNGSHSRPASGTGSEASAELIEDLQNENLRLNTEIARLQEELKALQEANASLTERAQLVEELTAANSKLTASNSKLTAANSNLEHGSGDVSALSEDNAALQDEVSRLTRCTVLLEAKVALVNELDEENKRAFEEVATLTKELARVRESSSPVDQLQLQSQKHQDELKAVTSELVELRSQKARAGQTSTQQQRQLEEDIRGLVQQVNALQGDLKQSSSEAAALRSRQVHQEHLEATQRHLQEEVSQLQAKLAQAQARATTVEGLEHANTQLHHQISKAHLELDHMERRAAAGAKADSLHSQVGDLQVQIATINSQHAAALDSKRALEDKQALMTQELNELRAHRDESKAAASQRSAPASPAKSLRVSADGEELSEADADTLAAYMEGIEAGQPLPHLATENRALQDMHKQLAGWISDIRQRKPSNADELPSPPPTSLPSPAPQAGSSKGRMASFFTRTNPNRTSRESRVRELLRATSQPRPHSPDVTEDAAAPPASEPAAQPTARPETISSPPQQQQQPLPPTASKRSPFAQSAAQSPDPMPTLAAVNTKRAEPARTRSAGSDFTMQQTADRQAVTAYQKYRGTNDVAKFLIALGYGGHIKPDQEAKEMLTMALNLTHRDQLATVSAWERACGTATHAKLKQWWVGEVGTELPIID